MNKKKVKKYLVWGMVVIEMVAILTAVGNTTARASTWHKETVDSAGIVGGYTSIALDSNDYPHISYFSWTYKNLKYAYRDVTGWHIETVDNASYVGYHTSIALDSNDYPHISYLDETNDDLKYAYKNATGWHIETVDSIGEVGWYSSIALDSNDYPHISYFDHTDGNLKYAYKDASGWHNETVDSIGWTGEYCSIALDSNDYPHISYHYGPDSDLRYAYKNATGWHIETVDSTGYTGWYSSIALDTNDYPHISYYDCTNDSLRYAYKNATGWHNESVDSPVDIRERTSIALDSNDCPHISYYIWIDYDLKYAYKDAGGWYIEIVDSVGYVGRYPSIALDDNDYPHISYYDYTNSDLKYATAAEYDWNYWSDSPNIWLIPDGNVGIGTTSPQAKLDVNGSLRVQGNGMPYLFFINTSTNKIGIGTNNPQAPLEVYKSMILTDPSSYAEYRMRSYSDTAWQGNFLLNRRYRGTMASPSAVQNGDNIFIFDIWGYDGSANVRAGQLMGKVGGPVSSGIVPGEWLFKTRDTAGNIGTRLIIKSNGYVGINTTNPQYELDVEGEVQAHAYHTGDIFFQKDGKDIWRMFEDENGVYIENLETGEVYNLVLQKNGEDSVVQIIEKLEKENEELKQRIEALEEIIGKGDTDIVGMKNLENNVSGLEIAVILGAIAVALVLLRKRK